jgi:CRISPR-associated protein (TIGR02584 family)
MKTKTKTYSRRILLAVTGLSPQVVTETLYALAAQKTGFIPTEIHLITTREGKQRAQASLLHPDGGQFHTLLKDYPHMGAPRFDETRIHIIRAPDGADLADIRTPEENAAAADAITALMADLTQDANAALHVSIAGGRKTMGFYLGYAFSLFARPQDRLSHVLVSSPFENHPEFYFPPAKPRRLALPDGAHIDTAQAEITLAEIPVVRLRHGLPENLQSGEVSFNEAVAAVQRSFLPPHLEIDLVQRKARFGAMECRLPSILFSWLAWWAIQAKKEDPMKSWREFEQQKEEYLKLHAQLTGPDSAHLENTTKRLRSSEDAKSFFEENNSKLKRVLRRSLGALEATPYQLIHQGPRGQSRRGLDLRPEAITLHFPREGPSFSFQDFLSSIEGKGLWNR